MKDQNFFVQLRGQASFWQVLISVSQRWKIYPKGQRSARNTHVFPPGTDVPDDAGGFFLGCFKLGDYPLVMADIAIENGH